MTDQGDTEYNQVNMKSRIKNKGKYVIVHATKTVQEEWRYISIHS